MHGQWEQYGRRVLSGAERGVVASVLRSVLALAEPLYALTMIVRNEGYDWGLLRSGRLPRPTISVGNLTAGGTGKTPVVRWLAERQAAAGHRPAVLLRGYAVSGTISDEAQMLREHLELPSSPLALVEANPDRSGAAQAALQRDGSITLFLLDDGFQHRKVARDVDLVLINAVEPFGYDHVHPRGLLREPLSGLSRADAVLITHASQIPRERLDRIEHRLRQQNPAVPIFHCDHVHTGLRGGSLDSIRGKRLFAFAGIGQPESFGRQIESLGEMVGQRWFGDHHAYGAADLEAIRREASDTGADAIVTTEKDWVKLRDLPTAGDKSPPIHAIEMGLQFWSGEETALLSLIGRKIPAAAAMAAAQ